MALKKKTKAAKTGSAVRKKAIQGVQAAPARKTGSAAAKALAAELQREKAFLEQLVATAAEGIVVLDRNNLIRRANDEFLRMFGFSAKEVIGQHIDRLIVPDPLMAEGKTLGGIAHKRRFQKETLRRRKNGSLLQVSIIGSPIVVNKRFIGSYAIYRDITRQKEAEQALRDSEMRYRDFFDNVPVGIFQTTPDGRYLDANAAHLQIFGIPDLETLQKKNAADFYSDPQERRRWVEMMDRENVMRAKEFHFQRGDGKRIWTRESARTVRDKAGKVLYYEGIVEDITALKLAGEAFNLEKAYLEQLFESAQEAIVLGTSDGQVIRVNPEFCRLFGYTAAEVSGRNIDDLISSDAIKKEAQSITQTVSQGRKFAVETKRRRKDGTLIDVTLLGSPITIDGNMVAIYGIYRDITRQKLAEARVEERTRDLNAKKNELERHATQAMLLYKIGQRVSGELKLDVLLNEIVASILETFHYYGVMLLLMDEKENRLTLKSIAGGYKDVFPGDLSMPMGAGMIGKAAQTRHAQWSGDVSQNPDYVSGYGEITKSELCIPIIKGSRLIGVLDLESTELNAFDESDITLMETLSAQIASAIENARLFELAEKARSTAEAASLAKGMFLSRMSHEIRTPLNSVIGFSDMLLDTSLSEEQVEFVRNITKSGEALLSLINEILDFSKIEAGKMTLQNIDFDLEITAFDVCHITQPRLGNKPVEVLCRVDDNLPAFIRSDPTRIRQVLLNLMSNAIKFTHEGEIELRVGVEREKEDRLQLHVTVRDTGIGIPADKLETVFELFQQVDGSITRKYGGTGLGLAICRQIARLLQGEVWAESELGKGSTFHFTAWVDQSEKVFVKQPQAEALAGKRALLMDDNDNNLSILEHVLHLVNMRTELVHLGGEVLPLLQQALAANDPFDICILDIQMPDLSGYEVSKLLRSQPQPEISGLKLLAFSSSVSKRIKMFKESGFDGFLPKPIQRHTLVTMIKRLLGEAEAAGEKTETGAKETVLTKHTLAEEAKHSLRILLAEDNPMNQKLAQFMLTKAGYQLEIADNGREAVEKYTAHPEQYDLIFMDVHMPEVDGLEATRVLRNRGYKDVPIVAMTADAMKEDREKCLQAGMNDYMSKPIKREDVFSMVQKWVMEKEN